ncbi:hypothetical protein OHA98_22365 [Streptomyces sp. NBC_00654]|nr:hypothetical protein [Streptomyces sp. NBC_00654]MCX4967452.1 hypothetical protein [Streptomyces sp. NBC_00654]
MLNILVERRHSSPESSFPTLLIFLVFQRNIMSGLTDGGLKG